MSHVRTNGDQAELQALLTPRDNVLVREVPAPGPSGGDGSNPPPPDAGSVSGCVRFVHAEGPFSHYERTVQWDTSGAGISIDQALRYRFAIPYWGRLFRVPATRALRQGLDPERRPWWAPPDRFTADQARVAAAATLLNVVGGMLYGLLTQVITFVSADLGNGTSGEQANVLAVVRSGIVVTIVVSILADRVGRRRMAIVSFCGAAGITFATALAPTLQLVAGAQFVARNLAIAALLCADTIATEEVPAGSRAMIAGLGTLAYGLGAGIVVMTLPLADLGPWGWRLTFAVAGLSLPLVLHARRHLPESRRFQVMDLDRVSARGDGQSTTPGTPPSGNGAGGGDRGTFAGRLVLVGAIFVLMNVFLAPASQLQNDYMRTEAHFSGTMIAVFVLLTSTPGGIGVLIGGRVADVYGRRWAIIPGLSALAVFYAVFFATTNGLMWLSSLLASIIGGMAAPALAVITAELFPTIRRATVRGVVTGLAVVGSIIGLLLGGMLIDRIGYGRAFVLLATTPLAAAAIAFLLPRTHGRELEETSS